jgi:hypothetical protein
MVPQIAPAPAQEHRFRAAQRRAVRAGHQDRREALGVDADGYGHVVTAVSTIESRSYNAVVPAQLDEASATLDVQTFDPPRPDPTALQKASALPSIEPTPTPAHSATANHLCPPRRESTDTPETNPPTG